MTFCCMELCCRVNWTPAQNRLFNGMVNILNSDHLARLACAGVSNEPIIRRTVIDKSVKRVRRLMATVSWDTKLTQWLHQLLIDNLSTQYLAAYLDILQVSRVDILLNTLKQTCSETYVACKIGLIVNS